MNGHFSPINGLSSVNGTQFSLCGTPTNLIFAHRECRAINVRIMSYDKYCTINVVQNWHKRILIPVHRKWQFIQTLAPLLEEIDICTRWLFCAKFNSKSLLFEAFLCNAYFWWHLAQSESTLPFLYTFWYLENGNFCSSLSPLFGVVRHIASPEE